MSLRAPTRDTHFEPYAFPYPNMLVQTGSKVLITGLQSETGQKLNGRTGTALQFYGDSAHWSVLLDDGEPKADETNEKDEEKGQEIKQQTTPADGGTEKTFKISIKNLSFVFDKKNPIFVAFANRDNPTWGAWSENGRCLVRAGVWGGSQPSLCLWEDPNGGLSEDYLREKLPYMGVPSELMNALVEYVVRKYAGNNNGKP